MNRFEIFQIAARLREVAQEAAHALEDLAIEKRHVPKRDRAAYMRLWRASKKQGDADEQSRDNGTTK